MRDTTFPVYEQGFSHHDAHAYENDKRQAALFLLGMIPAIVMVVAFVAWLVANTPV